MRIRHIFLLLLVTFIWGINFVIGALGMNAIPPLMFSGMRFLLAAIPAVFIWKRQDMPWKWILSIGLVLGLLHYSLLYVGIYIGLPPGLASLVVQIQVVFTIVFSALFLKERFRLVQVSGVFLSGLGIFLLVTDRIQSASFWGLVFVILAGASFAISNIMIKASGIKSSVNLVVWMSLVPIVPLFLMSWALEDGQVEALRNLNFQGAGAVAFSSYFGTLFGTAVVAKLVKEYSANVVSPFFLLVPIFGLLSSYFVTHEVLGGFAITASAMVFSGLAIIVFSRLSTPTSTPSLAAKFQGGVPERADGMKSDSGTP